MSKRFHSEKNLITFIKDAKKPDTQQKFEYCVLCGSLTDIPKDLHIDFRPEYINGGGQLCSECFISLKKDSL